MRKNKTMAPVFINDVEVEVDKKIYRGTYVVQTGVLTVSYGDRTKPAAVQRLNPEKLAQQLLRELVRGI